MTTTNSDKIMHFPTGVHGEDLLRVPLGVQDPHVVIRITAAIRPPSLSTTDSDPYITLSDGLGDNSIRIGDNSHGLSCDITSGSVSRSNRPSGSLQHYEYTFLFEPFQQFGACTHFGGHITTGYFTSHINPTKGLDFVVKRENAVEVFDFYYFLIEIL